MDAEGKTDIIWPVVEGTRNAALLSKFREEMRPTNLFCRSPDSLADLWVFWSHKEREMNELQDHIKTALCYYDPLIFDEILVQFWAPKSILGRLHLTTIRQPFAIKPLENEKLREYRKHCVGNKLDVFEEDSGIVGRVLKNHLPEFGPEIKYYSVREYPQRDFALSCGFNSTMALPLFYDLDCVGVIEVLFTTEVADLLWNVQRIMLALKRQHLSTIDMQLFRSQINDYYESHIQNEIKAAVEQVCKTYKLTLGVTWVSYNNPQVSFQGELLVPSTLMSFSANKPDISGSFVYCYTTPLRVNEGLVGKAFSSGNLHFCTEVSQLTITEYPHVHLVRKLGIAASFAVCLRNISTGNLELVIEFSLSREMTYNQNLQGFFPSILATMKQKLISFEVVTGDIEIEIFTSLHNQREQSDDDLASYMEISDDDSSQSLHTTEPSMNSTCRQPEWPSCKRVNELDQYIPESSFPVNKSAQSVSCGFEISSSSGSTKWMNICGYTLSANQLSIPKSNQSRMSLYSGTPHSAASANYADVEMITDVESITMKVRYREDIIKFDLPSSSSYANLVENILNRWGFLKDKAFVIKYLNNSLEPILLATDTDLQECMVWTRSRGINLIRMLIQLEEVVQDVP